MNKLKLKPRQNLQDQVAELLEKKVLSGDWPAGSKIPTEQSLCLEMGISRTILREAMAKLKSQGFLESRQGSGVYVIRNSHIPTLRIENKGLERIEALRELMELRFSVEINTAYLAALRRTETQMQAIWSAHEAMTAVVVDGALGVDEDMRFHAAIGEAANNIHFSQFLQFVQLQISEIISAARSRSSGVPGRPRQVLAEHRSLVEAIQAGNAEEARSAAWVHLINAAKRMGIRGLLAWENLRMSNLRTPRHMTELNFSVPDGVPKSPLPGIACDTHVTLLGDPVRYPMIPGRSYTPGRTLDFPAYERFQKSFGIERAVFIQASVYGQDNSLLLDSLEQGGDERYRGVALIVPETPTQELNRMHRLGVRAARVNALFRNDSSPAKLPELAVKVLPLGWHIELQTDVSESRDFYALIAALDSQVVVDHVGHIPSDIGVRSRGFQDMIRLLKEGRIWVRLSGFCRITAHESLPFSDIKPYVDALLQARPDRLLWGTNWPHPALDFTPPSEADLFEQFSNWVGDADLLEQIVSRNPGSLYWK